MITEIPRYGFNVKKHKSVISYDWVSFIYNYKWIKEVSAIKSEPRMISLTVLDARDANQLDQILTYNQN